MAFSFVSAATFALWQFSLEASCTHAIIPDSAMFCRESDLSISEEDALALLDGRRAALAREGEALLWLERRTDPEPVAIGAFPQPLTRLAEDIYGARYRIRCADEAIIDQYAIEAETGELRRANLYGGPKAPALPERRAISGPVNVHEVEARAIGERRRIAVWLPPSYDEDGAYPLLLLADGQGLAAYASLFEHLVEDSVLPPFVAVGIFSGPAGVASGPPRKNIRKADYLPGFDGQDGFARHLSWVADELVPWLAQRYAIGTDPSSVAIAGKSSGAVFALEAGSRRPDVIGHVIAQSSGWEPVSVGLSQDRNEQRVYLAAGLYEASFLEATITNFHRFSASGAKTSLFLSATGHSAPVYDRTLLDGLQYTILSSGLWKPAQNGPCVSSVIEPYLAMPADEGTSQTD